MSTELSGIRSVISGAGVLSEGSHLSGCAAQYSIRLYFPAIAGGSGGLFTLRYRVDAGEQPVISKTKVKRGKPDLRCAKIIYIYR